jgi:hypothetical protein
MPRSYLQSHNFRIHNRRLFCCTPITRHRSLCIMMSLGMPTSSTQVMLVTLLPPEPQIRGTTARLLSRGPWIQSKLPMRLLSTSPTKACARNGPSPKRHPIMNSTHNSRLQSNRWTEQPPTYWLSIDRRQRRKPPKSHRPSLSGRKS